MSDHYVVHLKIMQLYVNFISIKLEGKIRNQEICRVTVKFGLGVKNEAGQRLT